MGLQTGCLDRTGTLVVLYLKNRTIFIWLYKLQFYLSGNPHICESLLCNLVVRQVFISRNNPKNLDSSCKIDLNFSDCLERNNRFLSLGSFWKETTGFYLWDRFRRKQQDFIFQNNLKNQDPSCKMDLDF